MCDHWYIFLEAEMTIRSKLHLNADIDSKCMWSSHKSKVVHMHTLNVHHITVELQWLEHLWKDQNMLQTGVV